jgi:hypothetical protein
MKFFIPKKHYVSEVSSVLDSSSSLLCGITRFFCIPLLLIFFLFISTVQDLSAQQYDVLELENFDNTTDLRSDGTFINDNSSGGFADAFDVSANYGDPTKVTGNVTAEVGSVMHGADLNGTGGVQPTYLEIFDYTADHNDEIGFAGNFACAYATIEAGDVLTVQCSTDDGASWTTKLTLTGNGDRSMSSDDGTVDVGNSFTAKEFVIGDNLSGLTIKIKVLISGFASAGEAFALDEFKLVRTKPTLASEDFDNTTSLTTSSGAGAFGTPTESTTCDNNDIYDCSANAASPTDITGCTNYEDGSIFVLNHRLSTSAADGEELVIFSHVAANQNEISFRGNFTSFGSGVDADNIL